MKKIKVLSILPMLAIMALIFFFSSQTAEKSSYTSTGVTLEIARFLTRFISNITPEELVEYIHVLVRKCAHFSLYFTLGVTASLFTVGWFGLKKLKQFAIAFGICVLYAISDEIHQIFVPGRACMFTDVLIDSAGSVLGCLVFFGIVMLVQWVCARRGKRGN